MWDVGSSSFDSIMTTFIFTVYLTSSYFGTPEETSSALSLGLTIAGFLIAILAPVTGQRNDKSGRGIFWLGVNTLLLALLLALLEGLASLLCFIRQRRCNSFPRFVTLPKHDSHARAKNNHYA